MSAALSRHLAVVIAREGPISTARYMAEALGHPALGYYMRKDPFGAAGPEPRAVIESANASPIPGVAFYRDHEPEFDDYIRTPPHVAVEIMSPGQTMAYMRRKAALYFSFGVESVWVVDLERTELHLFEGGAERVLRPGVRLTSPAVPGLDVDAGAVFPRRRP